MRRILISSYSKIEKEQKVLEYCGRKVSEEVVEIETVAA
jgi:hypothetical protein